MPMTMTRVVALRTFFNQGASRPVETTEFMNFWRTLTDDEKKEYAESAASQLGVQLV